MNQRRVAATRKIQQARKRDRAAFWLFISALRETPFNEVNEINGDDNIETPSFPTGGVVTPGSGRVWFDYGSALVEVS